MDAEIFFVVIFEKVNDYKYSDFIIRDKNKIEYNTEIVKSENFNADGSLTIQLRKIKLKIPSGDYFPGTEGEDLFQIEKVVIKKSKNKTHFGFPALIQKDLYISYKLIDAYKFFFDYLQSSNLQNKFDELLSSSISVISRKGVTPNDQDFCFEILQKCYEGKNCKNYKAFSRFFLMSKEMYLVSDQNMLQKYSNGFLRKIEDLSILKEVIQLSDEDYLSRIRDNYFFFLCSCVLYLHGEEQLISFICRTKDENTKDIDFIDLLFSKNIFRKFSRNGVKELMKNQGDKFSYNKEEILNFINLVEKSTEKLKLIFEDTKFLLNFAKKDSHEEEENEEEEEEEDEDTESNKKIKLNDIEFSDLSNEHIEVIKLIGKKLKDPKELQEFSELFDIETIFDLLDKIIENSNNISVNSSLIITVEKNKQAIFDQIKDEEKAEGMIHDLYSKLQEKIKKIFCDKLWMQMSDPSEYFSSLKLNFGIAKDVIKEVMKDREEQEIFLNNISNYSIEVLKKYLKEYNFLYEGFIQNCFSDIFTHFFKDYLESVIYSFSQLDMIFDVFDFQKFQSNYKDDEKETIEKSITKKFIGFFNDDSWRNQVHYIMGILGKLDDLVSLNSFFSSFRKDIIQNLASLNKQILIELLLKCGSEKLSNFIGDIFERSLAPPLESSSTDEMINSTTIQGLIYLTQKIQTNQKNKERALKTITKNIRLSNYNFKDFKKNEIIDKEYLIETLNRSKSFRKDIDSKFVITSIKAMEVIISTFNKNILPIKAFEAIIQLNKSRILDRKVEILCWNTEKTSLYNMIVNEMNKLEELNKVLKYKMQIENYFFKVYPDPQLARDFEILQNYYDKKNIGSLNDDVYCKSFKNLNFLIYEDKEKGMKQKLNYANYDVFTRIIDKKQEDFVKANKVGEEMKFIPIKDNVAIIQDAYEEYVSLSKVFSTFEGLTAKKVFEYFGKIENIENELAPIINFSVVNENEKNKKIAEAKSLIKIVVDKESIRDSLDKFRKLIDLFGDIKYDNELNDVFNEYYKDDNLEVLLSNKNNFEKTKKFTELFMKENKQDQNEVSVSSLIRAMCNSIEVIKYILREIDEKSCEKLLQYDKKGLQINLIKLKKQIGVINELRKSKTQQEFYTNVDEIAKDEEKSKLIIELEHQKEFIYDFRGLQIELENEKETSKNIVFLLIEQAKITFLFKESNKENDFYEMDVVIENDKKRTDQLFKTNDKEFELRELWERTQLTMKLDTQTFKDQQQDESENSLSYSYNKCSSIIKNVFEIKKLLNEAYIKGCDVDKEVNIFIQKEKITINTLDGITITEYQDKLKETIKTFQEKTRKGYESSPYLPLIFGRQFNNLYKDLKKIQENFENAKNDLSLVKYITNGYEFNIREVVENLHFDDDNIFDTLGGFFSQDSAIFSEDIYPVIEIDTISPGIYIYYSQNPELELEKEIVKLSISLTREIPKELRSSLVEVKTGELPSCINVLICQETTSVEELDSFLYRFLKIPKKIPFILANFHLLKNYVKNHFSNVVSENRENKEIQASLFIISPKKEIGNELDSILSGNKIYNKTFGIKFNEEAIQHIIQEKTNVDLIQSNCAGLGKTYTIKMFAKDNNYNYFLLPIGKEATIKDIIERLQSMDLSKPKTLLHIMFYEHINIKVSNQFLFYFIFTRSLCFREKVFYLGSNVKLAIEIPYGFVNLIKKCPLLSFFNPITLNIENPSAFDFSLEGAKQGEKSLKDKADYITTLLDIYEQRRLVYTWLPSGKPTENPDDAYFPSEINMFSGEQQYLLISKYARLEGSTTNPTYSQLINFINLCYQVFTVFCDNFFFNPNTLTYNYSEIKEKRDKTLRAREFIFFNLLKICRICSCGAYEGRLTDERFFSKDNQSPKGVYKEDEENKAAMEFFTEKQTMSFEMIPKGLTLIQKDGGAITVIPDNCDQKTLEHLQLLWESGGQEGTKLKYFRDMTNQEYIHELENYFNLPGKLGPLIPDGYVFTIDNFFKALLIELKASVKEPVILMGETGCGKTFLVRMLTQILGAEIEILNVHAGTSEEDVVVFMNKVIDKTKDKDKNVDKFWIFFDELNTSTCMGLISEIMCNNTMKGRELKELKGKVVYIGACNPFRKSKNETKENYGLVYEKKYSSKDRVYNVYPLPTSLIGSVFDFGSLKDEDEKKYIKSIINDIKNIDDQIRSAFVEIISSCQKKLKEKEASAVSLRDVRRVCIFFKWFYDSYRMTDETNFSKDVKSVILSIYMCYVLRLTKEEDKQEVYENIAKFLNEKDSSQLFNKDNIERFIDETLINLIDRMVIPAHIAKNKALKENVFAIFNCVNNQIPIFICGKPGCSKTLSMDLLEKSLRGQDSKDQWFKELQRIKIIYYQGSRSTTSQDILSAFQSARDSKKEADNPNAVVFLDEMGLAEISPNNPLKVLHSLLEYDETTKEKKVAFVGISNWSLDASKQNRGIFLARPDLCKDDLKKTAVTICKIRNINRIEDYLYKLAEIYFQYKGDLRNVKEKGKEENNYQDFHGTRDFYNLIKQINIESAKGRVRDDRDLNNIINNSLDRNFRGIDYDKIKVDPMSMRFKKSKDDFDKADAKNYNEYQMKERIEDNLSDKESRFLLLISSSSLSTYILKKIVNEKGKTNCFSFIGSRFKNDLDRQEYAFNIIGQLKIHIEKGNFLILVNLESIYPALYDLFNQNYSGDENLKYTRISIGNVNNPKISVHEDFRCAVVLDEGDIYTSDPPFLNRFEKHRLTFSILLKDEQNKLGKEIKNELEAMTTFKSKCNIDVSNQRLNFNLDEILGIIYQQMKIANNQDLTSVKVYILHKYVKTFSQDLILFMMESEFAKTGKNVGTVKGMIDHYKENERYSFFHFLKSKSGVQRKTLIYTFTKPFHSLSIPEKIDVIVKEQGDQQRTIQVEKDSITEILVSRYSSERDIENEINKFYESNKNVLIIKFQVEDTKHLCHLEELVNNIEKFREERRKGVIVIFTVHIERIIIKGEVDGKEEKTIIKGEADRKEASTPQDTKIKQNCYISHISDFDQIFIDNLHETQRVKDLSFIDIIENKDKNKKKELIRNGIGSIFEDLYTNFNVKITNRSENNEDAINILKDKINILRSSDKFNDILLDNIANNIASKKEESIKAFLESNVVVDKDIDLLSRLTIYSANMYKTLLIKIVKYFEEKGALIRVEEDKMKDVLPAWTDLLRNVGRAKTSAKLGAGANEIKIVDNIKIFMSSYFFKEVKLLVSPFAKSLRENDDKIRFFSSKSYQTKEDKIVTKFAEEIKKRLESRYLAIINPIIKSFDPKSKGESLSLIKDYGIFYSQETQENITNLVLRFFESLFYKYKDKKKCDQETCFFYCILHFETYKQFYTKLYEMIKKLYAEGGTEIEEKIVKKMGSLNYLEWKGENSNLEQVNFFFFLMIEGLFSYILEEVLAKKDPKENWEKLFQTIENFTTKCSEINNEFSLSNRTLCLVKTIIEIHKKIKDKKEEREKLIKLVNQFKNEITNMFNTENKSGTGIETIKEEVKIIKEIFDDSENYNSVIDEFVSNKFKIYQDNKIRGYCLSLLLSSVEQIKNSKNFLAMILNSRCQVEDSSRDDFLSDLENIDNKLKEEGKEMENKVLSLEIMNVFEKEISCFLSKYLNRDSYPSTDSYFSEENKSPYDIFKNSFENVKEAINDVDEGKTEKYNLKLLFHITYIKMFLFFAAKIYTSNQIYQKYQNSEGYLKDMKNVISVEDIKEGKLSNPVHLYLAKCLLYHFKGFYKFRIINLNFKDTILDELFGPFVSLRAYFLDSPIHAFYTQYINSFKEIFVAYNPLFIKSFDLENTKELLDKLRTCMEDKKNYLIFLRIIVYEIILGGFTEFRKVENTWKNAKKFVEATIKKDEGVEYFDNFVSYFLSSKPKKEISKIEISSFEATILGQFFEIFLYFCFKNINLLKQVFEGIQIKSQGIFGVVTQYFYDGIKFIHEMIESEREKMDIEDIKEKFSSFKEMIRNLDNLLEDTYWSDSFVFLYAVIEEIETKEALKEDFDQIISESVQSQLPQTEKNDQIIQNAVIIMGMTTGEGSNPVTIRSYEESRKSINNLLLEIEDVETHSDTIKYNQFFFLEDYQSISEVYKKIDSKSEVKQYFIQSKKLKDANELVEKENSLVNLIYQKFNQKIERNDARNTEVNLDVFGLDKNDALAENAKGRKLINFIVTKTGDINDKSLYNRYAEAIKQYNAVYEKLGKGKNEEPDLIIQRSQKNEIINYINNPFDGAENIESEPELIEIFKEFKTRKVILNKNNKMLINSYKFEKFNEIGFSEKFREKYLSNKRKLSSEQIIFEFLFEDNQSDRSLIWEYSKTHKITKINENTLGELKPPLGNYLGFLDFLLRIMLENQNKNNIDDESLLDIIKSSPNLMKLGADYIEFFEKCQFKVSNLVPIYEAIESDKFDDLCKSLNSVFNDQNAEVPQYEKIKFDSPLTQKEMTNAIKKFVNRYLIGYEREKEFDPEKNLIEYMKNAKGIWTPEIEGTEKFNGAIKNFEGYKIKVKSVLKFYNVVKQKLAQKKDKRPKKDTKRI